LGMDYVDWMAAIHARHLFDWYLEVGCRKGTSFAPVRGKTIAVDPFFRIKTNVIGQKPALHIFQQTSDDFFAGGFLARNGIRLGFSFLDGMHHMEFLLRDVMQAEAAAAPGGVIALHDCCPFGHPMADRDFSALPPRSAWTGDVWKLIPILQQYRPDLKIDVLDCRPTGLVLLSNLDPGNDGLMRGYDGIVAQWQAVTLADHGAARFYDGFAYADAAAMLDAPLFDAVALPPEAGPVPQFVSL